MKKLLLPFGLFLIVSGEGCLKSPDFGQLSTDFVVVTKTDSSRNFSSYRTYYISDTVAYHSEVVTDTILNNSSSQQLVNAVKQNMNSLGYTFAPKSSKPDLGINMGVLKNTTVSVVYGGWWDYWNGWWDPWYWGWYYPYYYPWAYAYSITSGSVIVTMADLKDAPTDQNLRIVWLGIMGGAVGDNLDANVQRGVTGINQAFNQSPLLKKQ